MCSMSGAVFLQIGIETELRCHRLRALENGESATVEQKGLIRPLPETDIRFRRARTPEGELSRWLIVSIAP
jgi:hypothetical protein